MRASTSFRRTHISQTPILSLRDRNPTAEPERAPYKPSGLWYEVDGDWRRWCHGEMREWLANRLLYRVDLQEARVLAIRTTKQLRDFHAEYVKQIYPDDRNLSFLTAPDYSRLASEGYDGIEIAPYQWRFRLDSLFMWYYTWDCASGVIWNASKITITKIARLPDYTISTERQD